MSRKVTVAATQMACGWDVEANLREAEALVRAAAKSGAQIVLLQELFERVYFCQKQNYEYLKFATPLEENRAVQHFQAIAKELSLVLPISFYERRNNARFNTVAVIDADGSILGTYRKAHIPDGPGYSEKFYFSPGDGGFRIFRTRYATIGLGICWDQWFPECARAMALMGAELLFYPTAIGSEPQDPTIDSKDHWQICMRGHAGSNLVPVIASNRTGVEEIENSKITFYGSSFICDHKGAIVEEASRTAVTTLVHTFDLSAIDYARSCWEFVELIDITSKSTRVGGLRRGSRQIPTGQKSQAEPQGFQDLIHLQNGGSRQRNNGSGCKIGRDFFSSAQVLPPKNFVTSTQFTR